MFVGGRGLSPEYTIMYCAWFHFFNNSLLFLLYRSSPIEVLHTVLLGPYKYCIILPYLSDVEKKAWMALTKVLKVFAD